MKTPFTREWCVGLFLLLGWCSVFDAAAWAEGEISLPKPTYVGKMSVEAALSAVKSVRTFTSAPVTIAQAAQILWAANGNLPVDAVSGATMKVFPSAGGLYPLEVFLVTGKDTVTGLPAGVFQYQPQTSSLQTIASGDNRTLLAHAALSQMWLARAPALVIIAAVFTRTTAKYGPQGFQYVFMEAGNANQNIYLQAASLGLNTGTVGAFQAAQVSGALKLPANVTPLLIVAVGK